MAKDYKKLAEGIVKNIGFSIKDQAKVNMEELKKTSGVLGIV